MSIAFPAEAMELTEILVVQDVERSSRFYQEVLGAQLYREYGGTSAVLRFLSSWILLVSGGPPTVDKPTVTFAPPKDLDQVSRAWTIRVADCQVAYQELEARGAQFLTPPVMHGREIRCFLRDPDGHLIELSEYQSDAPTGEIRAAE
jgi:catechol 2,3-dioxygenase-like lactoylglutathione lyase family enzyme